MRKLNSTTLQCDLTAGPLGIRLAKCNTVDLRTGCLRASDFHDDLGSQNIDPTKTSIERKHDERCDFHGATMPSLSKWSSAVVCVAFSESFAICLTKRSINSL